MTEKNKPMSEVEIWERCNKEPAPIMELVYEVIQLSRLNTIPADRAIEVPDVGEWPKGSRGITILFTDGTQRDWDDFRRGNEWKIAYIPRPVPAWTPKVGDAVFYANGCNVTLVKDGFTGDCLVSTKDFGFVPIDQLKPFRESAIGLPWSEI